MNDNNLKVSENLRNMKKEADNFFKRAGDLDAYSGSTMKVSEEEKKATEKNNFFSKAGDLDTYSDSTMKDSEEENKDSIQDYLNGIVSESYRNREGYVVLEAGSVAVNLQRLNKMLEEGYTITRAESLGPSGLIAIEFEKAMAKKSYHI